MNKRGEHIALFVQRYKLLREIGQLQVEAEADESAYLARCCAILLRDPECCLAWVGRQEKDRTITPLHIAVNDPAAAQECQRLVHQLALEPEGVSPAARALATDRHVVCNDLADEANPVTLRRIAAASGGRSCISWPLSHDQQKYGVLTVQSTRTAGFAEPAGIDFIANLATAIARALHLWPCSSLSPPAGRFFPLIPPPRRLPAIGNMRCRSATGWTCSSPRRAAPPARTSFPGCSVTATRR